MQTQCLAMAKNSEKSIKKIKTVTVILLIPLSKKSSCVTFPKVCLFVYLVANSLMYIFE